MSYLLIAGAKHANSVDTIAIIMCCCGREDGASVKVDGTIVLLSWRVNPFIIWLVLRMRNDLTTSVFSLTFLRPLVKTLAGFQTYCTLGVSFGSYLFAYTCIYSTCCCIVLGVEKGTVNYM